MCVRTAAFLSLSLAAAFLSHFLSAFLYCSLYLPLLAFQFFFLIFLSAHYIVAFIYISLHKSFCFSLLHSFSFSFSFHWFQFSLLFLSFLSFFLLRLLGTLLPLHSYNIYCGFLGCDTLPITDALWMGDSSVSTGFVRGPGSS